MHENSATSLKFLLSQASLFANLTSDALDRLADKSSLISLAQNDLLLQQGARCDGFYLVAHGQIKLFFTSRLGVEKIIEIIGEAQTFGETMMFAGQHFPYSGQALAQSSLIHVPKAAVLDELEINPDLRMKMLAHMSMHLRQLMSLDQSNAQQSGTERFIAYLLRQLPALTKDNQGVEVKLPTSKGNISSLLNLTKEHLSRILRSLSERGLIAVNGCMIKIPDVTLLTDYRDHGSLC